MRSKTLQATPHRNQEPARSTKESPTVSPPKPDAEKRARRNADAHTSFVVLGAISTATFLVGGGLTIHYGLRYAKHVAKEQILKAAEDNSEKFFDASGELSAEARSFSEGVPGLYTMLGRIEENAESEGGDIDRTLKKMRKEAKGERIKWEGNTRATAIAAGVGVAGMLVFFSAAAIAKHRGLMLHAPNRKWRAEFQPQLSLQHYGAALTFRW
jgi:hypothetical protein